MPKWQDDSLNLQFNGNMDVSPGESTSPFGNKSSMIAEHKVLGIATKFLLVCH